MSATELREAMLALTRRLRRQRPKHYLTPSQMQILGDVERSGGSSAPVDLAALQGVRIQSLTSNLNALEAEDLVTRTPDPGDRRRLLIRITDKGTELVAADRQQRDRWLADAMNEELTGLERDVLHLAAPILWKLARRPDSADTVDLSDRSGGT
ncbi:MarR family transcriptional regulator [Rhodococcus sp. BP-252]|uniref:MarR family transcriptional regulator n=1 Tax=Rhodococcoides kyotonense TaxID=398843 RepID=A0A177YGI2_9NOCA|nr:MULTISPECIES: MarR family transcriptional regulator [Rhodococcus]MBY6414185.1 MarR family transcriptional regulator [Rhodococcus sp. BP-320]MBY6418951.1 MarR family transcriptional regulator [Rhodococcus sp. BP-321]MBY6423704.1 MarR family transcriptional regulator [Rhodococcus sp. BP-324]MBY6428990.1 MarR family transcriptional regulator [Rhodococcus sp. BP-323]MBY6433995.1 MarR family transcriptional regulator [Rhodococcus sp. BP-322]